MVNLDGIIEGHFQNLMRAAIKAPTGLRAVIGIGAAAVADVDIGLFPENFALRAVVVGRGGCGKTGKGKQEGDEDEEEFFHGKRLKRLGSDFPA